VEGGPGPLVACHHSSCAVHHNKVAAAWLRSAGSGDVGRIDDRSASRRIT
jgi:hypothetical protein